MFSWTDSANQSLEGHLAAIHPTLAAGGIDQGEIAAALRLKIEEQARLSGAVQVTREDVEQFLRGQKSERLQSPRKVDESVRLRSVGPQSGLVWGGRVFGGLFGVVLPLFTLVIESLTGMCAEMFDPIPSVWHFAAIALVALSNGFALHVVFADHVSTKVISRALWLNAISMGIAMYYSLWFAPSTPFAAVGILFFGLGLLPLSPLLSLIVAVLLRRGLRRKSVQLGIRPPAVLWGVAAGLLFLLVLEVPGAIQTWAVYAATNGSREEQSRALRVLRHIGDETRLLRGCYAEPDSERSGVLEALFGHTTQTDRQQVYYRVTGASFNSVPAPSHLWNLFGRGVDRSSRDWVWDESLGESQVGQRLKFLELKESRIDGTVDANAAAGNLEWTMVFRNDHESQQREARALIQLPPGAVVSRLTLWIDGEEREAAFGGRGEVRAAYQAVVRQRRDPVLVSTKGPDQVLLQCFPIQPRGGEMKVRIGIAMPLILDRPEVAKVALPRVIEQNFSSARGLSHAVWIEAQTPISSSLGAYVSEKSLNAQHAMRGVLTPAEFASPAAGLAVARSADEKKIWAHDSREESQIIGQEVVVDFPVKAPLAIVLDGSRGMAGTATALAGSLDKLSADFSLTLWIASDEVLMCPLHTPREMAAWLRLQSFAGGQDASDALRAAFESLGDRDGNVLWIYGAQPTGWSDSSAREQMLARHAGNIRIMAFPALPGPNIVLESMVNFGHVAIMPRLGGPAEDLSRVLERIRNGGLTVTRHVATPEERGSLGRETVAPLGQLWAADEVRRLLDGPRSQRDVAVHLAVRERIVTPVTSAVVLESKQQYDAAGLDPNPDAASSTAVPETAQTIWLVVVGVWLSMWLAQRRRWRRAS